MRYLSQYYLQLEAWWEFVVGDNKVRLGSKLGNDSEEGGSLTDGGGTNGAYKGILHVRHHTWDFWDSNTNYSCLHIWNCKPPFWIVLTCA